MRLGALDERWRTDPLAAQAEVLADLRAARARLEQFRRINGRGPRTLAEHNLVSTARRTPDGPAHSQPPGVLQTFPGLAAPQVTAVQADTVSAVLTRPERAGGQRGGRELRCRP